jgi:iron-sulfur cluster repair protein YtfE (RIC family)
MKSSRRHDSLIPLSREHQYALLLCLRIHRGLPLHGNDETWIREKAAQAEQFFATEIAAHFRAEEEVLFPAMRDFAGARALLSELLSEHRKLEKLAGRLRASAVAELAESLGEFADLLEAHIRKEERELFPIYERQVRDEEAAELGRAIRGIVGDATQPRNPQLLK